MAEAPAPASPQELEQRLVQLETLYQIGRECARAESLSEVVQIILSMLIGSFGATGGLAFVGDRSGRVEVLHARAPEPTAGGPSPEALARTYLRDGPAAAAAAAELELWLPLERAGAHSGAIALGPRLSGRPYSDEERDLLEAIVASAEPYLHNVRLLHELRATAADLERKVRALAVANEIALGMVSRPTFSRLCRFLVERVSTALAADEAALGVREQGEWQVVVRLPADPGQGAPDDGALLAGFATGQAGGPEEAVVPVSYGDDLIAALWLGRRPAGGSRRPFTPDERALLSFLANQAAAILENSRLFERFLAGQQEQFRLRGMLEQYMAPSVAGRLIAGQTRPALEGSRLVATVLMVDMRGSSELTNQVGSEAMVRLLNEYFGAMTDVFFAHEGTIDKFEGDGVIGFFGAPEQQPDAALRALAASAAMQRRFEVLRRGWDARLHIPPIGIGIGLATGEVVVGNIGSGKRLDHTAIGPAANLAPRLASQAPAGLIQLDEPTWRAVAPALGPRASARRPRLLRAKGFRGLLPIYRIRAVDVPPQLWVSQDHPPPHDREHAEQQQCDVETQ